MAHAYGDERPGVTHFLRKVRKRKGLTQTQLAERVSEITGSHMNYQTVQRYETGKRDMKTSMLPIFAEALGVTVRELVDDQFTELDACILEAIHKLSEADQRRILTTAEAWAENAA